jgi:quinohemoprotein ethanol dehydrogenase
VAYPQDLYTITMAPRIANGKVIVGVSGGDKPIRGFFDAYDAKTGRRAWRFYTVPGDPSKPLRERGPARGGQDLGRRLLQNGRRRRGLGRRRLRSGNQPVYVGTGNAEPWVQKFRGAQHVDNLYTCSILAVDLATGKLKWHYQTVPTTTGTYDSVQQLMLLDLTINGRQRKVMMQASKDGFFYVLDRITGRVHLRTGLHAGQLDSTASTSRAAP